MQCCMCVHMHIIRLIQSTNRVAVCSGSPGHNSGDEVNKTYNTVRQLVMASSAALEVFNTEIENIDDYKERFDFHCTANQIPDVRRKALFLTRDAFVKLKTLVSPTSLSDMTLSQIVTTMRQHYKRDTVNDLSFSNAYSKTEKGLLNMRKLGKTCNFGGTNLFVG